MTGWASEVPSRHPWASRVALAIALAVALGYAPVGIVTGPQAEIRALEAELAETRAAIDRAEEDNRAMRARARALKTDSRAIEDVARRELGWVRPGEVVVDLEPPGAREGEGE